jgi:hypothetical protein
VKKPPPKPDIHFRVTSADYQYLQEVAKAMDRSVSYLIERIVKEWIAGHGKAKPDKI